MSEQLKIFEQGTCVLFVSKDGEFTWADDADVKLADDSLWKNSPAMRHILLRLRASQSEPASKPNELREFLLNHIVKNGDFDFMELKHNDVWLLRQLLDAVPVNAPDRPKRTPENTISDITEAEIAKRMQEVRKQALEEAAQVVIRCTEIPLDAIKRGTGVRDELVIEGERIAAHIRTLSPPVQPVQELSEDILMKLASHAYNLGRDSKYFKDDEVREYVRSLLTRNPK